MDKKWCVYLHTSPSGKYYVGITSQKPERRWRNGKGYIHNNYFTNAINKYGWDNFMHEIIADDLSENEAKVLEEMLIKKFQSNNVAYGYNITSGGEAELHSERTKQLIRNIKGMPVCQFDLDMNLICEYQSAKEAAEKTGLYHSMILGCCHNKSGYKTAGGYAWVFKDDMCNIDIDDYKRKLQHVKLPKKICQFSLSMEFIREYESIAEASRITGFHSSNISLAVTGKCKQSNGYIWISKNDIGKVDDRDVYKKPCCKSVYQFSLDMVLIKEFESRVEAANSIGVTPQAIGYACNSKSHKSHGYIWMFKDDYKEEVA